MHLLLCEHVDRLKKQELASFAQSADEVVRAVEESVRKDLHASLQSSPENVVKPVEADNERAKLVIGIQDEDGLKHFRVYTVGSHLYILFHAIVTSCMVSIENLLLMKITDS